MGTFSEHHPSQHAMRRNAHALSPLLALLCSAGCLGSAGSTTPATQTSPVMQNALMPVPNVVGLPVLAAAARLRRAGFAVTVPRFSLGSQIPEPVVTQESPAARSMLVRGDAVTLKLGDRCCIGSPVVSTTRALLMPRVVGLPLDVALREVASATGFYGVSVPAVKATLQPLLATFTLAKQWPRPGRQGHRPPYEIVTVVPNGTTLPGLGDRGRHA
jgi:hypothetical protein